MLTAKTNNLTITTPEGINFSLQLAGPVLRFLAWSVDFAVVSGAIILLNVVVGLLGIINRDVAAAVMGLSYFAVSIGYSIALEWYWNGQTVGKRLLQLRVMDEKGLKIHVSQIIIRNLLRVVDLFPAFYFIGGLTSLISRHRQRLGDIAANTIVVFHPPIYEPDLNQLIKGKYNSFRSYPHLEARLRHRVTPQEAQIALQALLRRQEFDALARIEVFQSLVAYFESVVTFPLEATDGISDEQYLRNVVEALYRS